MRRAWAVPALAACLASGCGGNAEKPADTPAVIKQLSDELTEVGVYADKELSERDFSIPTTESVELLASMSVPDPETGQQITVYQIRWRGKTGYVPLDAIKR